MPRTSNHSISVIECAKAAADSATTLRELRLAQAILLPAVLGATIAQTAEVLGVGHATVSRLHAAFRTSDGVQASAAKSNWGGRRHCWMTLEEEKEFLAHHGWRKVAPDTRHPKSDPVVSVNSSTTRRDHHKGRRFSTYGLYDYG